MSYQVKVVLTTHGANTAGSTFNIYQQFDGYITPVATGVTYADITNPAVGAIVTVDEDTLHNPPHVRVVAVGGVCGAAGSQVNIEIVGVPTPTQTPTVTPTPTTFYPGCGAFLSDSYTAVTFHTYPDYLIDLSAETNGGNVRISYDAKGRANRFAIYDRNGNQIVTTGWVGDTAGYIGNEYYYPTGSSIGYIDFTYDNSKQYKLKVDTGGAPTTGVTSGASDNWEVAIICQGAPGTSPTPTVTPTVTPYTPFYAIIRTTSPNPNDGSPAIPLGCNNGGITNQAGNQLVWKFESNTNQVTTNSVITNFQGHDPNYSQLSDFNLQIGQSYWLSDLQWGYSQFTYTGGSSISLATVIGNNSCPVAYELPVFKCGNITTACNFHAAAVSSGNVHQYYITNGILIVTTQQNNNTLNDQFNNGYYYTGGNGGVYTPVIGNNNADIYIDQNANHGTFDNNGQFTYMGTCGNGGYNP
jgi:hypothetical protein